MNHFNTFSPKTAPMGDNDNGKENHNTLPVCLTPARPKPSLMRQKIPAKFLSQLIAERNRLATQRPKRRAPVSLATRAYNKARIMAIRRMPKGFNYENNA